MGNTAKTDLHTAIRHMVATDRKTLSQVSRELNRGRSFISVMFRDGTTPRLDLMAKIASVCGYDLVLLGHGEGLAVTATPQLDGTSVTVERRWRVVENSDGGVTLAPETNEKGFAIPWDGEMVLTDEQPTD